MSKSSGIKSTVISTVLGMSLLLFLLGLLVLSIWGYNNLEKEAKKTAQVDIFFREDVKEVDVLKIEKELSAQENVRLAKYVSQDSAKALMMQRMGEDVFDILDGANPFRASIAVHLNAEYFHVDSVESFKSSVLTGNELLIESVDYDKKQFAEISDTFKSLRIIVLVVAGVLLFICVALIYNTIRLAVFSKRFTIRTMQLVGAKTNFIRRPFLLSSLGQGFIAGLLAVIFMILFHFLLVKINPMYVSRIVENDEIFANELTNFSLIFAGIIILGIVISYISTFFALNKYLWMKTDKMY
jgi:cell division transport system permease protein